MASTRGGPTMIVHGASRGQNNFTLNGANFTNYSQTSGFNPPPPDAVQEIRVQTSTFSAEFGNNAGAQVTHGHQGRQQPVPRVGVGVPSQRRAERAELLRASKVGSGAEPVGRRRRRPHRAEQAVLLRRLPETDQPRRGGRPGRRPCRPTRSVSADFSRLATQLRNPTDRSDGPAAHETRRATCASPRVERHQSELHQPGREELSRPVHPAVGNGHASSSSSRRRSTRITSSPASTTRCRPRTPCSATSSRTTTSASARLGNIDYVAESNVADIKNYGITDTHTFSPTFLNELTVSYLDTSSFRTATERVPPRDMGINIDEGYLGVGMSLNVSGGPNLSLYRTRAAGLQKLALEGRDDARPERPHVQVGIRRAIRQLRPDSRQRRAQRDVHRHALRQSDGRLHARRLRQREPWIRRSRQLPAPLEASVLHSGRMEADAAASR